MNNPDGRWSEGHQAILNQYSQGYMKRNSGLEPSWTFASIHGEGAMVGGYGAAAGLANITNPVEAMMAYDIVKKQLAVYNGSVWSFWKP
ncbi:hypothetical protein [Soonwooa purpurea]